MSSTTTAAPSLQSDDVVAIDELRDVYRKLKGELSKVIVGQEQVIEQLAICLFGRGHALLMGVPGLAKTLLVSRIAETMSLSFSRIQFTPDLMPMDITGTDILQETQDRRREFEFLKGPVFANIVLADEINRAPSKTQAAMLEAMQEHRVTVVGRPYPLEPPFFVLATQNPVEQEGTYPLPEAQLDRFMFLINVDYPTAEEERRIARETTGQHHGDLKKVIDGPTLIKYQELVERVPVPDHVYDTIVDLVRMSRPKYDGAFEWVRKWVTWGAGPRAVQYLVRGAKARAVLHGSYLARMEDVEAVAKAVLTHRILTNFQAQSEGVDSPFVIEKLLEAQREVGVRG